MISLFWKEDFLQISRFHGQQYFFPWDVRIVGDDYKVVLCFTEREDEDTLTVDSFLPEVNPLWDTVHQFQCRKGMKSNKAPQKNHFKFASNINVLDNH